MESTSTVGPLRRWVVACGVVLLVAYCPGCRRAGQRSGSERGGGALGAGARDARTLRTGEEDTVEVRLERNRDGVALLVFRFSDRPGTIPRIRNISLSKLGLSTVFCSLDVVDATGPVISGYWPVASVPPNYRADGCQDGTLSQGDYELVFFTQRGESRQLIHVSAADKVQILPWEE